MTSKPSVIAQACLTFGQLGYLTGEQDLMQSNADSLIKQVAQWAVKEQQLCAASQRVIILHGTGESLDSERTAMIRMLEAHALLS